MKIPLSWLKDYVDIELSLIELARIMTMIGLEVEEVKLVGLPSPQEERHEFKFTGLPWDREKFVVAQVNEVMPHPDADRLVLCKLDDGQQSHVVLTGAPNLFPYKGKGELSEPLKVAYAKLGARLYDGHKSGLEIATLKKVKIRGVESYSMICSEKELGISDEHEGVILLDGDAPTGMPLVDYMGDAVFEIDILPNMIRNASLIGVAREVAAATGKKMRKPSANMPVEGNSVIGQVDIDIKEPELNPRFVLGMIRNVTHCSSPYWVQRRLRLAGMRPISSVVDATNYVMLETGQPLHAFDYDEWVKRTGGKPPTIITRSAQDGEILKTLDGIEHTLEPFTIVVADTAGSLSIAGVMGGEESEVTDTTKNVLLVGATWNMINVRRTVSKHRIQSEAGYRFSRGVHPEIAPESVALGLDRMADWSGGEIAVDLIDAYPKPVIDPLVTITENDVARSLGIELSAESIAEFLSRLEFKCEVNGDSISVITPPIRLDISEGVIGKADLMEEIARMYGYENIPQTRLADELPVQRGNLTMEIEEKIKEELVRVGLQEVVTYRLTSPEREARAVLQSMSDNEPAYVRLQNPIAVDRCVLRRGLLSSVFEVIEKNIRNSETLQIFEIGPCFLPESDKELPLEQQRLAIAITGLRKKGDWDQPIGRNLDFYDLKGILDSVFHSLNLNDIGFEPFESQTFHPGKCAQLIIDDKVAGVLGEMHPLVKQQYNFGDAPILAAELDMSILLNSIPEKRLVKPVPLFPPVIEDIAVVVNEDIPAADVFKTIRKAGGTLLVDIQLFDIYKGKQIGEGEKSLAFKLFYQAENKTLNDKEATKLRNKIVRVLEHELNAKLRSK